MFDYFEIFESKVKLWKIQLCINDENTPLVRQQGTTTHTGLLDPRGPYVKWIAVFFMCFLSFGKKNLDRNFKQKKKTNKFSYSIILGSYYCYDNPTALQDVMKDDLKITSSQFTAFYSWYSWPNVV